MNRLHNYCLVLVLFALLAGGLLPAGSAPVRADGTPSHWWVYIGTYTRGDSEGIYLLHMDAQSGHLEMVGLVAEAANPSFLAMHPERPLLYVVSELWDAEGGPVKAYTVAGNGELELLNEQSSLGAGPCHVTVHPSGEYAAAANYGGGSTVVFPIGEDGRLGEPTAFFQHEGSSVHPQRQQRPHAHSVNFDAAGRFLFVADLGIDKVLVFRFDEQEGTLEAHDPPAAELAPGAGPRHFAFHPSGRFAYAINELDSTVTAFAYDAEAGRLTTIHTVPTLPDDFDGNSTTAEVRVHPSGRFLYGSNRGHDSIAAFAIDTETGRLTPIGHSPTQGSTPRNFNIDPSGSFLLAANQESDTVVAFRIDPEQGSLEPTGQRLEVPTPVAVLFASPGQ